MRQIDANEAAYALQSVQSGLRRGARTVGPRHPVRYGVVTCLLAAAGGASFDIPAALWGVGAILRSPLPMVVVLVWTLYTRAAWRARPLPTACVRVAMAAAITTHLVGYAGASLAGLALRDAGVPLPFSLAGLGYGVYLVAVGTVAARWLSARYAEGIERGQW